MNHPSEDTLLLLAYGELDETERETAHGHLAGCPECRARLDTLERARVALEWTLPRRRARGLVALVALAAAATLAVVLLRPAHPQPGPLSLALPRYTNPALAPIDSVLTRLEQEKPYAIP
jgi:anti-sigma factor RsiW